MELTLQNSLQHKIADMLWSAKDEDSVKVILAGYGKNAEIVYNMMIAAVLDDIDDTELAMNIIQNILNE